MNAPQGSKQRVEVQVESGKWKWCLSVSFFLVSNKFQFLQQKREKLFFSVPLPFSLMPCDSLNCRHSDAAADVAVAAGFAVYRTFLAFPLHWGVRRIYRLERASSASSRWQICKFMLWLADRRGNETKQTNFAPKHAQSRQGAKERVSVFASRMHQVKVKNFRRATRKSVLKSIKKFSVCIRWRFMSISHPICTALTPPSHAHKLRVCNVCLEWKLRKFCLMQSTHIEGDPQGR